MSNAFKSFFRWSRTSFGLLSGFLLLLFLIGYVWWPLLEDYLSQFNPDYPVWYQIDWLLIGNFLIMSILIMLNANLKRDVLLGAIALAGGYIIEAWGTRSGLWVYYTYETPPLWIIPAWPIAVIAVNRLYSFTKEISKSASQSLFDKLYWPVYILFYILLWQFALKGLTHPLTWFALAFCGLIIISEKDKRSSLILLFVGSVLGYFLERWGTTRLCWAYHTGGMPPFITVVSHGMASVAMWRVYRTFQVLFRKSGSPGLQTLIVEDNL